MAGYGLTQATQNVFNTKWAMEDRNRREMLDEEARQQRERAELERQQRMDYERQRQQMAADAYERQIKDWNLRHEDQLRARDEELRQLGLRQAQEAAVERSSLQPFEYDGADFAPIEGARGLQQRGMMHVPTYLQEMQQADPQNALTYRNELQKMRDEGVFDAAKMLRHGNPAEAARIYNTKGTDKIQGFYKSGGKWMVREDDGDTYEFDVDSIIAQNTPPEKGRYSSDKYGVLDTATGKLAPHAGEGGKGLSGMMVTDKGEYMIPVHTPLGTISVPFSNSEALSYYKQNFRFPDESLMMYSPDEYEKQLSEALKKAPPYEQWLAQFPVAGVGGEKPQPAQTTGAAPDFSHLWNGNRPAGTAATAQPQPAQPAPQPRQQLRRREEIEAEQYRNSPQGRAEQLKTDIANTPRGMMEQSRGMAQRFGLEGGAGLQDRGKAYTDMAMSETRVSAALQRGILPDENDLIEAIQFAMGVGNAAKASKYEAILNENYQ